MLDFLIKAIAISVTIILSSMVGGAIVQSTIDQSTPIELQTQVEIKPSPSSIPTVVRTEPKPSIPPIAPILDFRGNTCTKDCSGHEAGYEWAEEKGIEDPDDCGGNSDSFIEGCRAYAEEMQQEYSGEYNNYEGYDYSDYDYGDNDY